MMRGHRAPAALEEEEDPLILACRRGRMGDIMRLLSAGIDPNISSGDGADTPLTTAAAKGRLEVNLRL